MTSPEVIDHVLHEEGTTHAVEFEVEGTVCLYSQGTAAGSDRAGDNGFSVIVAKLLKQYKPRRLYVATFSRLVRSQYFAHDIFKILKDEHIELWDGTGEPIRCWTSTGRMRWQMLVMFVDMEHESILMRLIMGKIAQHRRGEWVQTSVTVPFGYKLVDKKLVPDPDSWHVVNKAIRVLGTPGVDRHEAVRALGAVGLSTPADGQGWGYDTDWVWDGTPYVPQRYRDRANATDPGRAEPNGTHQGSEVSNATAADGEHPGSAATGPTDATPQPGSDTSSTPATAQPERPTRRRRVDDAVILSQVAKRLLRYLDLWEHGVYKVRHANNLDMNRYAEYPVHRDTDDAHDLGYLEFIYRPEPPPRPWATPEEFHAARVSQEASLERADRRVYNAGHILPLLGHVSRYTQDGWAYALLSSGGSRIASRRSYHLWRQPDDGQPRRAANGRPAPLTWARRTNPERFEKLATMMVADLHGAVARAATRALQAGLPLRPDPQSPPAFMGGDRAARRTRLRRQITDLRDAAEALSARAVRYLNEDAEYTEMLERQARDKLSEARTLQTQLDGLDDVATTDRMPDRVTVQPQQVAQVIAGLQTCDGSVPAEIAGHVAEVITNFRMWPEGALAGFSFDLRLPAEDGIVLAGPITGTVPNRHGANQQGNLSADARQRVHTNRAQETARLLLTTNTPVADLVSRQRGTGGTEVDRVHQYLQGLGLTPTAARAALAVVPLITRQTIWALLHNDPLPDDLPDGFADRIRHTYIDPGTIPRTGASWFGHSDTRQAVHAYLLANPGTTRAELQAFMTGNHLGADYNRFIRRTDVSPANLVGQQLGYYATGPDGTRRIYPIRCPHCDNPADTVLKVHEVFGCLMCSSCSKDLGEPSPVYPPAYFDIDYAQATQRVAVANPRAGFDPAPFIVAPAVRDRVAAWADRTHYWPTTSRAVNGRTIEAYFQAIARGQVNDSATIRDWAQREGHLSGNRGPVPEPLREAFILTVLKRTPGPVRAWAVTEGLSLPRSGPTRDQLFLRYAQEQADNTTSSASQ